METLIQFSKRKEVTNRQKIGISILLVLEVISAIYWKVNKAIGIENYRSDRVWFYGFSSFVLATWIFYGIMWKTTL